MRQSEPRKELIEVVAEPDRLMMSVEDYLTLHPFGPGDQVELASLSLSFPIEALYEDVTLPEDMPDGSSM